MAVPLAFLAPSIYAGGAMTGGRRAVVPAVSGSADRDRDRVASLVFAALQSGVTCFFEMAQRPSIVASMPSPSPPVARTDSGGITSSAASGAGPGAPGIHPALAAASSSGLFSGGGSLSLKTIFSKATGALSGDKDKDKERSTVAASGVPTGPAAQGSGALATTHKGHTLSSVSMPSGSVVGAGGTAPLPMHLSSTEIVQEAADTVLRHLMVRLQHFPVPGTAPHSGHLLSTVAEDNDPVAVLTPLGQRDVYPIAQLHFVYDNSVLISAYEQPPSQSLVAATSSGSAMGASDPALPVLPSPSTSLYADDPAARTAALAGGKVTGPRVSLTDSTMPLGGSVVRVVVRDKTGKYAWDFRPTNSPLVADLVQAIKREKETAQGAQERDQQDDDAKSKSAAKSADGRQSPTSGAGDDKEPLLSPRSGVVSPRLRPVPASRPVNAGIPAELMDRPDNDVEAAQSTGQADPAKRIPPSVSDVGTDSMPAEGILDTEGADDLDVVPIGGSGVVHRPVRAQSRAVATPAPLVFSADKDAVEQVLN